MGRRPAVEHITMEPSIVSRSTAKSAGSTVSVTENFPFAGLVNLNGTFYGTTVQGGQGHCPYSGPGCGTVYEISSSGEEKTLYSFRGGPKDGSAPWAGLVALNGVLYGTTSSGGSGNTGILYSLTTLGKEHVLHSFDGGTDGGNPYGTLIAVNGTLYGTSEFGGSGGNWARCTA